MTDLFRLPTKKQLAMIRRELGLDDAQANDLDLAIRHAYQDLEGYYRTRIGRGPRKDRMDQLQAFEQALGNLIEVIGDDPDRINDDLPFAARETIGWCTSSQLIEAVTGEGVSVRRRRVPHKEQSVGLHHGARLLAAQLRLIRDPIVSILSEKSTDTGGPEPNHVPVVLIRALAGAAPDIIGKRATATANGKFEQLVGAVFEALGIESADLRKTIERILYKKSSKRKART
mgnify:CR=1 FL=1